LIFVCKALCKLIIKHHSSVASSAIVRHEEASVKQNFTKIVALVQFKISPAPLEQKTSLTTPEM